MKKFYFQLLSLLFMPLLLNAQVVGPGDWSSVRLYGHAFNIDDFSTTEYDWIENHNYFFTIEKRHAKNIYGAVSSERASAATAAKIIANNSSAKPLFYWNTKVVYDYIYETIEAALVEHPEWNNDGNWTYEDPEFRTWFVDVVKDQVNNQGHAGVFLDGALSVNYWISPAAGAFLEEMIAEMPGIVIFNGFGPHSTAARFDYLEAGSGAFLEHFFRTQCNTLHEGKTMLDDLLLVPNDKIIIANGGPESTFWNTRDHKFSLAAFLIIANDNSYYHYLPTGDWSSKHLTFWDEDFGKTLGAPLGVASVNGYVYTRTFANASVILDLENKTSSITWVENPDNEYKPVSNLALSGTATQSSTDHGGEASRANDGNSNGFYSGGSVTHTENEDKPWWLVDLGSSNNIGEISVFGRTDECCKDRLSDFTVYVLDEDSTVVFSSVYTTYPDPSVTMNAGGVEARFVKVQLNGPGTLSLAEVKVLEVPTLENQFTVSLKITDDTTNDSITVASLDINDKRYTSNYVGELALKLDEGTYPFTLSKEGYDTLIHTLNITKDTALVLQMTAIPQHTLSYRITDDSTYVNLPDVELTIDGKAYTTDDSGEVSLKLYEDEYEYTLSRTGYQSNNLSINLDKDTLVVLQMDKERFSLVFQVKDAATDENIQDVLISINDSVYETDALGSHSLVLDYGDYDYTVSKVDYEEDSGSISLAEDTNLTIFIMSLETGVKNPFANEIEIYPNPVNDALNILLVNTEIAKCEIFSIGGELIHSDYIVKGKNFIEVGDFVSGIYLVKVVADNQIMTREIVKK